MLLTEARKKYLNDVAEKSVTYLWNVYNVYSDYLRELTYTLYNNFSDTIEES